MNLLSSRNRLHVVEKLKAEFFDLVVIGGGITGAGIALDAASRGMKVALVEKNDFASGTSSRSTKLIHGGLRYLKQFEIGLVREVGKERAIVHNLALHLVKQEKMLLPIIRGGTFGRMGTSFGLWLYDFVAGVAENDRRRMLSKQETLQIEPLLRAEGLLGSGLYAEYRTDDARLTIEIIKTAVSHGAFCLNYAEVQEFVYEKGKVSGVRCLEKITGENFIVSAAFTISATGPWVDEMRKKEGPLRGKRLFLSKGVHIVIPHHRLPLHQAVYFDVGDGRMMFAIPRHRTTYIGTTDTPFHGNPNNVLAEKSDVEYILEGANGMFPAAKLTVTDIESTWAGLRPLIYEPGKTAGEMSRRNEIIISESGLISIAGGKLTGYRKMAKKVVDLVAGNVPEKQLKPCTTDRIPLTDKPFTGLPEVMSFQKEIERQLDSLELPKSYAPYLVENYGKVAGYILKQAIRSKGSREIGLIICELHYSLEHEMVIHALDFFRQRTVRLFFNLSSIRPALEEVLKAMQDYFGWTAERVEQERKSVEEAIQNTYPK